MVFAALLPEALKNIGRFKAQKGTTLWSLWNLMNTNSITDPFKNWWAYPGKLPISILAVICLLSPLGSQSTLRLLKHSDSPRVSHRTIRYLDSGPVGNIFPNYWACDANEFQYPVSTRDTYLAALMQGSDTKQGPRDQWGNVKIPRLPDPSSSEADSDGWFQVPNGTANPERYSSLSGMAIVGIADLDKEDVEFTVETSYVELACSEEHFMSNVSSRGGLSVTCPDCGLLCATGGYNRTAAFLGPPFPGLTAAQLADPSMTRPRSIVFNSTVFNGQPIGFLQTTCQVTQQHVETHIECTGNECHATKIRSSKTDHRSGNYTSFDDWGGFALDVISRSSVPGSVGVGDDPSISPGPSTSELFLQNSSAVPASSTSLLIMEGSSFNLSTVNIDVFATRASILLNTALQVFTCPSCFAGNFPSNMSIYGPDYIPVDGLAVMWRTYNLTMALAFDGGFPRFRRPHLWQHLPMLR
ncbi:hypothetical protein N7540_012009 [Penicillium herquei]|nr:hypothetical protein N7540_012009 [Penicillium herquei]